MRAEAWVWVLSEDQWEVGETSSHTVEGQRKCGIPQNQLPTAVSKPWEEEDKTDLSWYCRYLPKCPYFEWEVGGHISV